MIITSAKSILTNARKNVKGVQAVTTGGRGHAGFPMSRMWKHLLKIRSPAKAQREATYGVHSKTSAIEGSRVRSNILTRRGILSTMS